MTVFGKKRHPLGFWQLDPLPTLDELVKFYEEVYFQTSKGMYASTYMPEEVEFFQNRAAVTERIMRGMRGDAKGTVYDVGCGEAFFVDWFHKQGWTVEACDFSSHGITTHNPHLLPHFLQGDIYEIIRAKTASGRKFDIVNLHGVLEHVLDPLEILDMLKGLMHEGTLLRLSVPNDYSKFQELLLAEGCIASETWFSAPDHVNYFNFESMAALLADRGFRTIKMISEFPIEMFLLNEHSNYWMDRSKGRQAHMARVKIDNFLARQDLDKYIAYMEAAAGCEFGRDLTAFVTL